MDIFYLYIRIPCIDRPHGGNQICKRNKVFIQLSLHGNQHLQPAKIAYVRGIAFL